mmetsp:Transcript_31932/g.73651  ORF Transcript_31932/g.73651 Transcript_31932/m.73651 type:complete len:116 (+) Transcript_31932:384-731(+)
MEARAFRSRPKSLCQPQLSALALLAAVLPDLKVPEQICEEGLLRPGQLCLQEVLAWLPRFGMVFGGDAMATFGVSLNSDSSSWQAVSLRRGKKPLPPVIMSSSKACDCVHHELVA